MSRHRGHSDLPKHVILEDRLLYLLSLDKRATEIECIVEFPDTFTRDRAMVQLQGAKFKSQRIVTCLP
ncbi:hypothetical protein CEP51_007814 [Fusarium floridanum]|uniref:Uncharacterized protein n=1 Tax=Fusarium floridanum TaxID=1325733 RepID=A0A428RN03_9HYPO|nr:hypothetical protein CEP51_007814 [Fusarium floridanum]